MTRRPINHRLPIAPEYAAPATLAECIAGTERTGSREDRMAGRVQCGAYSCRANLLTVESSSVPGRRHNGLAPPGTLSGGNTSASAPSCMYDVIAANPNGMSCAEIAKVLGCSTRDVELTLAKAIKAKGAAEVMRLWSEMENLEGG